VSLPSAGSLVLVLMSLENAAALSPKSRIEGAGDDATLLINKTYGLGERFSLPLDWLRRVEHLAKVGSLTVEHQEQKVRIGRGPRAAIPSASTQPTAPTSHTWRVTWRASTPPAG
jgi:hypothetical protein